MNPSISGKQAITENNKRKQQEEAAEHRRTQRIEDEGKKHLTQTQSAPSNSTLTPTTTTTTTPALKNGGRIHFIDKMSNVKWKLVKLKLVYLHYQMRILFFRHLIKWYFELV